MESRSTIPIAEKFLGSLLGAYIGNCRASQYAKSGISVGNNSLSQLWLTSIQPHIIAAPTTVESETLASYPVTALPWLLYHHDNSTARYQGLAQTLESVEHLSKPALPHIIGATCILGDCLEWLVQHSLTIQQPRPLLCKHLLQRQTAYPRVLADHTEQFIDVLAAQTPAVAPEAIHAQPLLRIASAVQGCLDCRENLALALVSAQDTGTMPSLMGCLLGAWGGLSVIPIKWLMTLPNNTNQSISHMAEQLYRSWAGIISASSSHTASSLDF